MHKTYFGLDVLQEKLVSEDDIKTLPFYDFWLESASGSAMLLKEEKNYVYLSDWEAFCKLFIQTGRHRNQV